MFAKKQDSHRPINDDELFPKTHNNYCCKWSNEKFVTQFYIILN